MIIQNLYNGDQSPEAQERARNAMLRMSQQAGTAPFEIYRTTAPRAPSDGAASARPPTRLRVSEILRFIEDSGPSTVKQISEGVGVSSKYAQNAAWHLKKVGSVHISGKVGRRYVYAVGG